MSSEVICRLSSLRLVSNALSFTRNRLEYLLTAMKCNQSFASFIASSYVGGARLCAHEGIGCISKTTSVARVLRRRLTDDTVASLRGRSRFICTAFKIVKTLSAMIVVRRKRPAITVRGQLCKQSVFPMRLYYQCLPFHCALWSAIIEPCPQ